DRGRGAHLPVVRDGERCGCEVLQGLRTAPVIKASPRRTLNFRRITAYPCPLWCGVFLLLLSGAVAHAQFQMPDPKQMSGIPRPVDDLPAGSISVRLIRGSLSNNITGHPVELHVGANVQTVKTDDAGRAQFDKVPAGTTVKASADVDGEHLES